MLMGFFGNLGTGKTLALTYYLYKYRANKIYSNYRLSFPHTYIENPEDLLNVSQGYIGLDELWAWIDSRVSGSRKNRLLGHFLLTSRKRGCHVLYTAQHFKQIDKRIRNITDILVFPTYDRQAEELTLELTSQFDNSFRRKFTISARPLFGLYDTAEEIEYAETFGEKEELERSGKGLKRKNIRNARNKRKHRAKN